VCSSIRSLMDNKHAGRSAMLENQRDVAICQRGREEAFNCSSVQVGTGDRIYD
jgi:hypothetical protein